MTIRRNALRVARVVVHDDGLGLHLGFSLENPDGLAQIVRTLVSAGGRLVRYAGRPRTWHRCVVLRVPVGRQGTVDAVARYATVRPRRMSGAALCKGWSSDPGTGFRAGVATPARRSSSFHASPDARVLAGIQCPAEALCGDRAPITNQFRVSDLRKCRITVSYRKNSSDPRRQTALWRQSISRYSSLCAQRPTHRPFFLAGNGCTRKASGATFLYATKPFDRFPQAQQMSNSVTHVAREYLALAIVPTTLTQLYYTTLLNYALPVSPNVCVAHPSHLCFCGSDPLSLRAGQLRRASGTAPERHRLAHAEVVPVGVAGDRGPHGGDA